jgi:dihydrofolate reductase
MQTSPEIRVFKKLKEALDAASDRTLFIIGGGELYKQTINLCSELYVSEVHRTIENGDAFFPIFKNDFKIKEKIFENDDFTLNKWKRIPS